MPPRIGHRHGRLRPTFIRQWREHRGLSQDQLVERVRERLDTFSKSTLSRLENTRQAYTQPMLEAIAWALGCEPEDLIMRTPDSPIGGVLSDIKAMSKAEQEQLARIVAALRKAS
jgi:transcriptional regulator with XRE-family HTH domain